MRNILTLSMLSAAALCAVSFAHAKEVKLSGLFQPDQVRAACRAVGGISWSTGGRYGCENKSKGTSVTCKPGGECVGEVPDKSHPQRSDVHGVLTAIVNTGGTKALSSPGILEGPGGFASQGPSATGSAAPAPSAPSAGGGIIR
ncbi:MAG: hypothetical protein FJX62_06585 [Alphaproteobacteria bacterium]|nr:hypothetical protein [Alphaproteobacteria bacterium]